MSLTFPSNFLDTNGASYSGIDTQLELDTWYGSGDHSNPDLIAALIGMTNRDYLDCPMASPNLNEGFFLNPGTEFSHTISGCATSISNHHIEHRAEFTSTPKSSSSPSSPPTLGQTMSPTPSTNEITVDLGACSLDWAHLNAFSKTMDSEKADSIVHWYGPDCRSPQEGVDESFERHQALLQDYIHSNTKLATQVDFLKKERKKRKTDSNLVQDYRFIVSLHQTLKKKEFGANQRVSSKAIVACLGVTPSWLSRAKGVVLMLDKYGPEGTSPDPLVIKRLKSRETTHKGSCLLTFLKERASLYTVK